MPWPGLLALALGLAAPRAAALRVPAKPQAGDKSSDCGCLIWKDVYALHNVTCGLGLERYSYEWTPINSSQLVTDSNDSLVARLNETERLISICDNFYHRMNHNYAMNEHANYIDVGEKGAKRVWCYVKDIDGCDKSRSEHVEWSDPPVRLKLFKDTEVPSFRKLSMEQILDIAKTDTLDLAMLLPAGAYTNMVNDKFCVENVTRKTLEPYQKMRKPIMLESKARKLAKLFVYGHQMITFLPGWPHGAVPFRENFQPTEAPDCPEEDCLEFDDYNEFCIHCDDDDDFLDPSYGDFSKLLWNKPK
mmetsp:Transcript_16653/g.52227  ORF Transcript_16653/g.52227 Transcript_16653/m.52227 type:complete len:304 (+) Transcript_16653:45-956(+)